MAGCVEVHPLAARKSVGSVGPEWDDHRVGRRPSRRPHPGAIRPDDRRQLPATAHDVQEDPVHTDLFLRIYQQQERELEQQLAHRLAASDRAPVSAARGGHHPRISHLRMHRKTSHG